MVLFHVRLGQCRRRPRFKGFFGFCLRSGASHVSGPFARAHDRFPDVSPPATDRDCPHPALHEQQKAVLDREERVVRLRQSEDVPIRLLWMEESVCEMAGLRAAIPCTMTPDLKGELAARD
jgi:hypothetical protein